MSPEFRLSLALYLTLCATTPAQEVRWSSDKQITLTGPQARHQLVLMAPGQDLTRKATYACDPEGIVEVDRSGYLRPLRNGTATITATWKGARSAVRTVTVERHNEEIPVSFANEIVPLFTRHGCNGGSCHGKVGGQNGFQLSLFGFEPWKDRDHLTGGRIRRIFRAAPEHSLLVLKASGQLPHKGGSRLQKDSDDYRLLVQWIGQIHSNSDNRNETPGVEYIVVMPSESLAAAGASQQLRVTAHFTDGSTRDITRAAVYESNNETMAEVELDGLVHLKDKTGTASVMVRFQEHVTVFRATIPLGVPVEDIPQPINVIDEHVFAKLRKLGLPPSGLCDDGTFLRRATVDITGRLPTLEEARAFLDDESPDKRSRVIDALLDSSGYADYFAGKWASILRNQRRNDRHRPETYAFHEWIRQSLQANRAYDDFVRDILTATGTIRDNPPVAWYRNVGGEKERMQDMGQVFLGVRLQCAQCHHHPYEKWSQDDYYGLAAFFTTLENKQARPGEGAFVHRSKVALSKNPGSEQELGPALPGRGPLELAPGDDPRQALADWVVDPENPYFARMIANRYWKHFFGRGLVDPEDDMRTTNPPTHPALLATLEEHVIESKFDLKALIRLICNSGTYQRSSIPNEHNKEDQQNYSRFYPRRLQAEVLADAINQLTNGSDSFRGQPAGARAVQLPDDQFAHEFHFLAIFGRPNMASACECERTSTFSLAQAVQLVNSKETSAKLASPISRVSLLLRDNERTDQSRIEELYLRAYSRPATSEDLSIAKRHLDEASADPEARRASYEDLVWALLNSRGFIYNH
ncbi:MAG: DUF1553 domain-containing protein [Roseibacillus sp.]|nr:DUF1553 domain-containing protein [Roseibacillus sp.]